MKFFTPIILTLGLFTLGCGTDTGNPGIPADGNANLDNPPKSQSLRESVCQKLSQCLPVVTWNRCMIGVGGLANLNNELGFQPNSFEDFLAIERTETAGLIMADPFYFKSCNDAISSLSCASEAVQQAYVQTRDIPYYGVEKMFSPSCQKIYE